MLVTYNGVNLADESKYLITNISGWDDMPDLVSGSAVRPRRHGSWPGGLLAPKRVVTVDFEILSDRATGNNTAHLKELRKAMALSDTEKPLAMDLDFDLGAEEINAKVTSLLLPMRAGYYGQRTASVEFTATDPRRYAQAWNSKTFGIRSRLPVPQYPVKYPKKYTSYSKPGDLAALNLGEIETPPVFTIAGPIAKPSITITDGQGTRKISFDLTVPAGKNLVIDVQKGTAILAGANFYGDSRGALLEDMFLRPGLSTIHFAGTGNGVDAARLTAAWRSASL